MTNCVLTKYLWLNNKANKWKINKLSRFIVFFSLILFSFAIPASESSKSADIHALKAIFLFNFANFVEWPKQSFIDQPEYIHYCIAGNIKVLKNLRFAIKGERIKGKKLKITAVNSYSEMSHCHIVFFSTLAKSQNQETLKLLAQKNILTVGENTAFLSQGGMLNLTHIDKHIQIEISLVNVKSSKLKVSSKLLRLAKIHK
jgi:YfiR/HmsC-like